MIYSGLSNLDIKIDSKIIKKVEDLVAIWELRGQHPVALNSATLGVYSIAFLTGDRNAFFDIFGLTEAEVKLVTQKIEYIQQDRKITSDPFNILCVWVMCLAYRDIPSVKTRDEFVFNVVKYLHYRFFTSLVNHYWSHGANEKVMNATINGLSKKFDITIYGTWKKVIEARCIDFISSTSISHLKTLQSGGTDDKDYLYILSDLQSRIRDKIKLIYAEFIETKNRGEKIGTRGSTATSSYDGEKILVHTSKTLDLMIYNLQNEILTERLFIDNQTVNSIASRFTNISEDMLKSALKYMVDLAKTQSDSKELDIVKTIDGQLTYVGMRVFISNLLQKTYRYCMHNGIDITNKAQMFIKIKNVYSSSRISDEDILVNKQSIAYLVDNLKVSRRETTISSLRLALLMYIIVRSFRFI